MFFSLIVTQVAFRVLPGVTAAKFLAAIFPAYYTFEMWVGGIALVSVLFVLVRAKMVRGWLLMVLTLAAWLLVIWADHLLGLMQQPATTTATFHRFHQESIMADGLVGVLLVIGVIVDSWR